MNDNFAKPCYQAQTGGFDVPCAICKKTSWFVSYDGAKTLMCSNCDADKKNPNYKKLTNEPWWANVSPQYRILNKDMFNPEFKWSQ